MNVKKFWMPIQEKTDNGKLRRVGVEIELAGLKADEIAHCIVSSFGGKAVIHTPTEINIEATRLGDFTIELDSNSVKALAEKNTPQQEEHSNLRKFAMDIAMRATEQFVPWEVVTPPIAMTGLVELNTLIEKLRSAGALGTRHAPHYAFGVHLNPELPNIQVDTILNYLRAFLCLYDWIVTQEKLDTTRKLTPYINHFKKDYISLVIDTNYRPTLEQLIDDYLDHNLTRNRSLDLLPLFAYIDEKWVRSQIDDERIKARPTLHYRLPNCDIDNPSWDLKNTFALWVAVENLAANSQGLASLCHAYQEHLERLTHPLDGKWLQFVRDYIDSSNLYKQCHV